MAADEYRRNAIECFRIADETISARSRVLLMHMAESWLPGPTRPKLPKPIAPRDMLAGETH